MSDKRKRKPAGPRRRATEVTVAAVPGADAWQLVHPRCAQEREDDMEEVRAMIDAAEEDIAIDELRWLLGGCSDFIAAHRLLGELHLLHDNDLALARAHFGYAFQIGVKALCRAGMPAPVPYTQPENQPFLEAGKGLAHCLIQLGSPTVAREVLEQMLHFDPTDPLGAGEMLNRLDRGELPL